MSPDMADRRNELQGLPPKEDAFRLVQAPRATVHFCVSFLMLIVTRPCYAIGGEAMRGQR
jgi:hypothetical protein